MRVSVILGGVQLMYFSHVRMALEMAMSVGRSVQHFGRDWKISYWSRALDGLPWNRHSWSPDVECSVILMILGPPWSQHLRFWEKSLNNHWMDFHEHLVHIFFVLTGWLVITFYLQVKCLIFPFGLWPKTATELQSWHQVDFARHLLSEFWDSKKTALPVLSVWHTKKWGDKQVTAEVVMLNQVRKQMERKVIWKQRSEETEILKSSVKHDVSHSAFIYLMYPWAVGLPSVWSLWR